MNELIKTIFYWIIGIVIVIFLIWLFESNYFQNLLSIFSPQDYEEEYTPGEYYPF